MQHSRPDRVINVPERCVRVDSRQSKVAHEHAQFDGPQRGWVKDSLASLAPLTYLGISGRIFDASRQLTVGENDQVIVGNAVFRSCSASTPV